MLKSQNKYQIYVGEENIMIPKKLQVFFTKILENIIKANTQRKYITIRT